jgi:DNA-directed RNA polymerase specialized sigma24 family protein
MSESPSFDRLLSAFRKGDKNTTGEMIDRRFASRLIALATTKINKRLARRVGPEDVKQSVLRTFFRRLENGDVELRDWDSLWGLLAQIAVRRIRRHAEYNTAARRSQEREVALTANIEALDREPDPSEVLIVEEIQDRLLADMSDRHRPKLQRIMDGAKHGEIARELGTSISTLERVHRRARELLTAILASEAK